MDFTVSDEQAMLRDGLTRFLATRYDLAASRTAARTGWQPEIAKLANLRAICDALVRAGRREFQDG